LARFLALFCLLSVSSIVGRSEAARPLAGGVAVYFKGNQADLPVVLDSLRSELGSLLNGAAYRVEWGDSNKPVVTEDRLVVIELRGTCLPSPPSLNISGSLSGSTLASSQVANDRVLPFISVNCAVVNSLLDSALVQFPAGDRDVVFGRALARLVAHELYHFLTQTTHHTKNGIAKARVTAADLLSNHFDFDAEAFSLLHESIQPAHPHTTLLSQNLQIYF
jgi:hypothetical protein